MHFVTDPVMVPPPSASGPITAAAVVAPELSKIADASQDVRDNHNDSSSSIEAEQNVSNQTVIQATNDTDANAADSINVKFEDEVKVSHYLKTLSLIDTFPFLGQRSVQ